MESPIIPHVLETSLSPGTYKVTPQGVAPAPLATISSSIPMKYNRRVQFIDSVKRSLSSVSLESDNADVTQIIDGEEDAMRFKYKPRSEPVSQMEPLSVTSLHQRQALVKLRPNIEIRLRRPMSLHDVSGEMVVQDITKELEKADSKEAENSPKPTPSSTRRFNRWSITRKLARFNSSPNLAMLNDGNKGNGDDVSSPPRSRTCSGSSTDNLDSPSTRRRNGPDFLSRFKKKKSKETTKGQPLRIEIFKKQNVERSQTPNEDHQKTESTELKTMGVESGIYSATGNFVPLRRDSQPQIPEDPTVDCPSTDDRVRVHLLFHFTSQLPCDDSTKTYAVVKDATHALPLKDGETLITDILSNKMVLFDAHGMPKVSFIFDEASEPWGACLTSDGTLAVTLKRHGCVSLWSLSGLPLSEFGHDVLVAPTGIQVDSLDRFVITDEKSNTVCIFDRQGQFLLAIQSSGWESRPSNTPPPGEDFRFDHPRYVCITKDGHYLIADSANHCIRVFDPNGNFCNRIGSFGHKDGHFRFPYGVACDSTGLIYIADHFNHRISVFNIEGVFQQHVLTYKDGISRPKGLAIQNSHMYVTYGSLRAGKISVFNLSSRQLTLTAHINSDQSPIGAG